MRPRPGGHRRSCRATPRPRTIAGGACHHRPVTLDDLTRKKERRLADRAELDRLLDEVLVATLATVTTDGRPWAVPMLLARDGDRMLLHGSTGAGALRQVAAGAEAVRRGVRASTGWCWRRRCSSTPPTTARPWCAARWCRWPATRRWAALDAVSDGLLPGRRDEVRGRCSTRRSPPPSRSPSTSPTTTGSSRSATATPTRTRRGPRRTLDRRAPDRRRTYGAAGARPPWLPGDLHGTAVGARPLPGVARSAQGHEPVAPVAGDDRARVGDPQHRARPPG